MTYREQPMESTYSPPAYPRPDWVNGWCRASNFPGTGWLVLSGESLVWLPTCIPSAPEGAVSQYMLEAVRDHAAAGTPAAEAWGMLRRDEVVEMDCSQVLALAYA
jgi:hypothetical protein